MIITTDFHIFQRGRYTTNQLVHTTPLETGISAEYSRLAMSLGAWYYGVTSEKVMFQGTEMVVMSTPDFAKPWFIN